MDPDRDEIYEFVAKPSFYDRLRYPIISILTQPKKSSYSSKLRP